jgi:hypothetical protein
MAGTATSPGVKAALRGPRFRIGHTGIVTLAAGERPFIAVDWREAEKKYAGWVYINPAADAEDPWLRAQGLNAEERRRPCYCVVAAGDVRWRD